MKATELMIGDWVCYSKPNGYLTRVDDIRRTGDERSGYVYSITCKRDERDPLHEKAPVDAFNVEILHPIPLTPEILISNGFVLVDEKDKMYRWQYDETAWVTADFKGEEPWAAVINTCYQSFPYCPYLHQLQHALLLCGILKELKPVPVDSPLSSRQSKVEMYQDVFGFDFSVWKEVPSMELIAKLMKAGLTSNTTDTEMEVESARLAEYGLDEPYPGYWDTLPERVPLAVWSAKELEKLLPPFLDWVYKPMRLNIYQTENGEYVVAYKNIVHNPNDEIKECRDEVLANALAKMTLTILDTPELRKQYEDYYNNSKM